MTASGIRVISFLDPLGHGRLAQLVARFLHTEEVIGSSPVSPTMKTPGYPGVFVFQLLAHSVLCGQIGRLCGIGVRERSSRERPGPLSVHLTVCIDALCDVAG